MQQKHNAKIIIVPVFFILFLSTGITAQIPPAGKYNTTIIPKTGKLLKH